MPAVEHIPPTVPVVFERAAHATPPITAPTSHRLGKMDLYPPQRDEQCTRPVRGERRHGSLVIGRKRLRVEQGRGKPRSTRLSYDDERGRP